jgi:hypothetical protein
MRKDILSYKDFSLFSNRKKSKWKNDGIRSIYESIIPKDVIVTLDDWKSSNTSNCVLIGCIALSYYIKPRYTEDIDLIFLTDEDIPLSVYKFRRNRKHSYEHIKTGVEVELITPEYINKDNSLFKNVFETSIESDGIQVASPLGLISLKLFRSKTNERDRVDIIELCRYCYENNIELDISNFYLTEEEINIFNQIKNSINFDSIHENKYLLEYKSNLRSAISKKIELNEYEIYLFEERYGEPRFHFGKKHIGNRKYKDFQFSISLTKTFDNLGKTRVIESSTGYKSFNGFDSDEQFLKNWLKVNINKLRVHWNSLNKRKIKIEEN